ncbi:hypothetical protein [Pseudoalteromonas 'SMAR']|uniref:hypothetical protein n=1 Tax=Pseudoalteromonas 'SMAR' TaxID=3416908 RepID=UPI003AF2D1F9
MKIGILSIALMVMANSALADCKVALQKRLEKDLDLSYQQFDQTKDSGFRLLEQSGCYAEAATLIKSYIAHNNSKESSLTWHLAQMEGLAGNYQQAIFQAKKVLKPNENLSEFPMYWNDFVLGNIAFWSKDKGMLKKHMANIEQGVSFKPNQINLNYLNLLLKNFNSSYLQH